VTNNSLKRMKESVKKHKEKKKKREGKALLKRKKDIQCCQETYRSPEADILSVTAENVARPNPEKKAHAKGSHRAHRKGKESPTGKGGKNPHASIRIVEKKRPHD